MIAESMVSLVKNSSVIRAMFEEGTRLAKLYGPENVYDFSLGNPNVPAPAEVNKAIKDRSNYRHAVKPYTDAKRLLIQQEAYNCMDVLEERYNAIQAQTVTA